jgi:hypothetical protein
MSQVETVQQSERQSKLHGVKERIEAFLKTFEWTWTRAVTFSFALVFFITITTAVIPSFWLYFANTKLQWDGGAPHALFFWNISGFWLSELRDAIAVGLVTGPFVTVLVLAAIMQNWRRKLRGSSGNVRPTGGYR